MCSGLAMKRPSIVSPIFRMWGISLSLSRLYKGAVTQRAGPDWFSRTSVLQNCIAVLIRLALGFQCVDRIRASPLFICRKVNNER